jgi:NIMA-interacting peptidyl-prolyl cis-trans isomerase 1
MAMQYSDESADADETEPTLYEQRGFSTSHILVKHSGSARQASWRDPDGLVIPSRTKEDAAATLSKLREELQELDGERRARRFAELAFEVSDCGTAREGGHLGDDDELKLDEFEEEFEAAIHSLGAWELSKIVETDSGSHLIMRLPNGFDASPNTTPPEPPNSVPDRDEELASMDQTDSLRSASIGKPKAKAQNSQAKYIAKKPKKPKHLEQLHGSTLRQQEERKMRELFEKADTDGGGTLQLKEIKQLCRDMGDRISTTALEEGFYRMCVPTLVFTTRAVCEEST